MLEPILKSLEKSGFLHERLGNTRLSDKGSEMYMGVCKAPKDTYFRRIDIKVYPKEQYGFALLYFTGSDYFNRSMRLFAEKKGYSGVGLYTRHTPLPRKKATRCPIMVLRVLLKSKVKKLQKIKVFPVKLRKMFSKL